MAGSGPEKDRACVNPELFNKTGLGVGNSWSSQDRRRGTPHTKNGLIKDNEGQNTLDRSAAQQSPHPSAPLDPVHRFNNSNPYFVDNSNGIAHQVYQTATPNALDVFNSSLGRSPVSLADTWDGHLGVDDLAALGYNENDAPLSFGDYIHDLDDELPLPSRADGSARPRDADSIAGLSAHSNQSTTNATLDSNFGLGATIAPGVSRQFVTHVSTSQRPAEGDDSPVFQAGLHHATPQVGEPKAPEPFTPVRGGPLIDQSAIYTPFQLVIDPAQPVLRGDPLGRTDFVCVTFKCVGPLLQHQDAIFNDECHVCHHKSAGCGLYDRAVDQSSSGTDHIGHSTRRSEYYSVSPDPLVAPSSVDRQNQKGSRLSHETLPSSSDCYLRPSHHEFGYSPSIARQTTPTESFADSFDFEFDFDSASQGVPSVDHLSGSNKRKSMELVQSAQESTQWSFENHVFAWHSRSLTMPSHDNHTKKLLISEASGSAAGNSQVVENNAGPSEVDLISPTHDAVEDSRQLPIPTSARKFGCNQCRKKFETKSGLRHHVTNVHNQEKKTRYKCDDCHQGFPYPKDLRRHRRSQHPSASEDSRVKCPNCDIEISRGDNLTRHLLNTCHGATIASAPSTQEGLQA